MNLEKLLEKRNTIYGICALWIILFHVYRHISMPYIPVVTNIVGIGNMAVDIFFFFSGLCLSLSAKRHNDYSKTGWMTYFKRRFKRILPPYLIIGIPYYIWNAVFKTSGSIVKKAVIFLANISSATFWIYGTQTTWYVYGIIVFYCLFPAIYTFAKKGNRPKRIILIAGMIIFAVISAYLPIIKNSMIVWARLPIFTIGVITGIEYEKSDLKGIDIKIALVILALLGILTSYSEISESFSLPQVYRLLTYIPMTISLLTLLSRFGQHKYKTIGKMGQVSLEAYLIHITLLHPIKYYGIMDKIGYWLYLLLPVVTFLIAFIVSKVERSIIKEGATA